MLGCDNVCGRDRRLFPHKNGTVRLCLCACALGMLLGATISSGQYLETTIILPDTLGALNGPYHLACTDDPTFLRLYIGGEGDSGGVIVAEANKKCRRLARIPTGPVKVLCYVQPRKKLYVAGLNDDTVKVVDCVTNQIVSAIQVSGEVPVMQYNSQNDRLYCGGNSVSVIDCAADTVIHTLAVAATAFALDSTNNKLYAGCNGPLAVIDCAVDSVIAAIPRIDAAGALSYNVTAQKVYAASGDTLYAIQTGGDSIVARLPFAGLAPILTCDPQRNRIYCAYSAHWASIDCVGDTVTLTVGTGVTADFMACNVTRDRLYLLKYVYAAQVYDASTGQLVKNVMLDGIPGAGGWIPGLDRLFCAPGSVTYLLGAVDGTGDSIAGIVPMALYAGSLSPDTVHNRLYFAYGASMCGCIGVADCSQNVVTSYAYAGEYPAGICYNPNNNRLYWGARYGTSTTVTVFDCSTGVVTRRIPVSGPVSELHLHPGLNRLYAYSHSSDTFQPHAVNIIDCDADSVEKRVVLPDEEPLNKSFIVPEDERLWYLGVHHIVVLDCRGDSIIADALDSLGSFDDACACPEDRKIYTSDGQVIDMDNPAHVESVSFGANRFCYVPSLHKLYGCSNRLGPPPPPGDCIVRVLDTRSDSVTASFFGPRMVSGMCLDHTGNYIYCAVYADSMMFVIDVRGDSVISTFRVPIWAAARDPLAANRRTDRIYEAQYDSHFGTGIPVIRDSMLIGLEELESTAHASGIGPTLVSRSVPLRTAMPSELYDASGRRIAVLRKGLNDVSQLVPGVYFVREEPQATSRKPQAVRKVVVAR